MPAEARSSQTQGSVQWAIGCGAGSEGRRNGPLLLLPVPRVSSLILSVPSRQVPGRCSLDHRPSADLRDTRKQGWEQSVRIRGCESGIKMLECGNRPSAMPPGLGNCRQAGQRGNLIEATSQRVPAGLNPLLPTLPGVGATAGDDSRLVKPQLGGTRRHCFQLIEPNACSTSLDALMQPAWDATRFDDRRWRGSKESRHSFPGSKRNGLEIRTPELTTLGCRVWDCQVGGKTTKTKPQAVVGCKQETNQNRELSVRVCPGCLQLALAGPAYCVPCFPVYYMFASLSNFPALPGCAELELRGVFCCQEQEFPPAGPERTNQEKPRAMLCNASARLKMARKRAPRAWLGLPSFLFLLGIKKKGKIM